MGEYEYFNFFNYNPLDKNKVNSNISISFSDQCEDDIYIEDLRDAEKIDITEQYIHGNKFYEKIEELDEIPHKPTNQNSSVNLVHLPM